MKHIFKKGDTKTYTKKVKQEEIASFESGTVHEVYSTFSIAKDAEWSGRLFVLDMKEDDEEGIGTSISVNHKSPAFVGEEIMYIATFEEITDKKEIITSYKAYAGKRLIAEGIQGQRILPKAKIDDIFIQIMADLD
jgi:fluoroacetyl-CoA thioesterase